VESAVVAAEEAVSEAVAAVAEAVAAVAAAVEERRRGAAEAAVTDTALAEISEIGVEAEIAEMCRRFGQGLDAAWMALGEQASVAA
jgi:hypothetical protein